MKPRDIGQPCSSLTWDYGQVLRRQATLQKGCWAAGFQPRPETCWTPYKHGKTWRKQICKHSTTNCKPHSCKAPKVLSNSPLILWRLACKGLQTALEAWPPVQRDLRLPSVLPLLHADPVHTYRRLLSQCCTGH